MNRLQALLLTLLVSALPLAQAADWAQEVKNQLADAPLLRGQFTQKKQVAGFKRPLLSSGDFLIWREHGILWNTRKPFAGNLTLTRKSLSSRQGNASYRLDASKEPGVLAVNELLFALLSGDVAALTQRFQIQGQWLGKPRWQLELTPVDAGLARVFKQVMLRGDRYVREAELQETNGDHSLIQFSQLAENPPATADEGRQLAE